VAYSSFSVNADPNDEKFSVRALSAPGGLTLERIQSRISFMQGLDTAFRNVELKSLKLYLQQYRNRGIFYEHATNHILDDLVAVVRPRWMTLRAAFTPRGGISTTVTARYEKTARAADPD
jgi:hypothetical protein